MYRATRWGSFLFISSVLFVLVPSVAFAAGDGSGTMTVNPTVATAREGSLHPVFTFTNNTGTAFAAGSEVTLIIPSGWTTPDAGNTNVTDVGGSGCSPGTPTFSGMTITVHQTCAANQSLTINYGGADGPAFDVASGGPGVDTFTTKSQNGTSGLTTISATQPTITVSKNDTSVIVNIPTPDSVTVGHSYSVNGSVTKQNNIITAPTGTFTFSDGTGGSCTTSGAFTAANSNTFNSPSCSITSSSVGVGPDENKTISATYNGDANFNSTAGSNTEPEQVTPSSDTVTITNATTLHNVSSVVGQGYTINVSVARSGSAGQPGGSVQVSDGTDSCTDNSASGSGGTSTFSCTLHSSTAGAKTLTATYESDPNFFQNTGTASHTVNKDNTLTFIVAPSSATTYGNDYTVEWNVDAAFPGSGTPTGTVTVTANGVTLCSNTPASGGCTVPKSLTVASTSVALIATYGGDANYNGSSANHNHTVNKTSLTITADNQSIEFGSPDPAFTFHAATFVNSDTAASFSVQPTCSVSGAHTAVNTYPIVCSGGSSTNYNFSYVNGTLSVTPFVKLSQTLAFNPALSDVTYGDPNFTLGVSTLSTSTTNFEAFGACDVAGAFLQLLGVGNCNVAAINMGDSIYNGATTTGSFNVNPTDTVVYDAISSSIPPNVPSLGVQANQTAEFGDYIHLAGSDRLLNAVTVMMSDWAVASTVYTPSNETFCTSNPSDCTSTGFIWPITLNIYSNHLGANGVPDELLATKTEDVTIPWRPEADPTCSTPTAWRSPVDNTCYNGLAFNTTFDLSNLGVVLPSDVIVGVAYNTETWGANPVGVDGPYDSLNIGLGGSATVGTDDNTDNVFWNTSTAGDYTDHGAAGVDIFRQDTNWTPYGTVPFEITASPVAQHSTTTIVTAASLDPAGNAGPVSPAGVLGSTKWFMYNDTNDTVDNTLGTFVAGPATPPNGSGSVQFTLGASPLNRQNIATYQFSGTPLSDITAMSYTAYSHSGVAGATESPYLNFNVDFTGTSGSFQKRLVWVPSVNGTVPQDNWNTFDTINGGNGMWVYSGANWPATLVGPDAGLTTSGLTPRTWSAVLADYPAARLLPVGGWLGIRVGEPGPTSYTANIDNFTIGIRGGADATTTAYDFEQIAMPIPTPVSPANGTVINTGAQQLIDWTDVSDGLDPASYVYQSSNDGLLNPDGSFINPVYTSGLLSSSQIATPGTPAGTYYWHVYAEDSMGNKSGWSTTQMLIVTDPNVITDPADSITTSDATLNGMVGSQDAQGHSFWVSTSQFSTSSPSIPAGVYSTPDMGAISANSNFSASLSSLTGDGVPSNMPAVTPNTTYYVVAWADVGGIWYPGDELTFTTSNGVANPFVTTGTPTSITTSDATLNGMVGGSDASEESLWVSLSSIDTSSSNIPAGVYSTPVFAPVSAGNSFSTQLSTLESDAITTGGATGVNLPAITPSMTYYVVAWADVNGIWYPGNQQIFSTLAQPAFVTTDAANPFADTTATLNGTNGPSDADNTSFWWGTTLAGPFTSMIDPTSEFPAGWSHDPGLGSESANNPFSEALTGLIPGTTYYFTAWSHVGGVWYPGAVESFTTTGVAPSASVATDAANPVADVTATLNGQNGGLAADNTSFWWGSTSAGAFTPMADPSAEFPAGWSHDPGLGAANAGATFNEALTGLTPSTQYWFAAWSHVGGIWYPGDVLSFTTSATPPPTPVANDDTAMTDINTPVTINVLANDSNATDLASFTQPTNGVVATSGTEVLYTPNSNYAGNDSFTYIASGPGGDSNSATVTVTVKDTTVPVLTVNGDNPAYVQVGSTYSDQGVTVTDTPVNGLTYTVTLDGVATTTAFTLDTSVSGTHTVVYSATDGGGNTGMATRTIAVLDAPTVTLTSTSTNTTSDNPIHVVADFSEPVLGFDETDVDLSSDSLINFAQASSTEYSFDLIPNGANISATIDQHKFTDLAGGENQTGASIAFVYSPLVAPASPSNSGGGGGGGGGNGPVVCATGDLNCDGVVDLRDVNILISNWGATGSNLVADLNHDGIVGLADLNILLAHWTQ